MCQYQSVGWPNYAKSRKNRHAVGNIRQRWRSSPTTSRCVGRRTWRICRFVTLACLSYRSVWFVVPVVPTFYKQMSANPRVLGHRHTQILVHPLCWLWVKLQDPMWKRILMDFFRHVNNIYQNDTHNIIVGYDWMLKWWATCVKREQSILPTRTLVLVSAWATWPQMGSVRLQWPHHGA